MQLRIEPDGTVLCVYEETIDLSVLGVLWIDRAGRVEPDQLGRWSADLSPLNGPRLGPYRRRSEALTAEAAWVERHLFGQAARPEPRRPFVDPTFP